MRRVVFLQLHFRNNVAARVPELLSTEHQSRLTSYSSRRSGYIVAIHEWTANPTMMKRLLMHSNEVREWALREGCQATASRTN